MDTQYMNLQDAQKGRPARPQQAKRRIVLGPYGEPLSAARTPLADFFRILLLIHLPREVRYGEGHAAEKGDQEEAGEDADGETR